MNYFNKFEIPVSFEIDRSKLDAAYRKLQQATHPDKFVNEDISLQRQAVQESAVNNEGYQLLKSPVTRACHLLEVSGFPFDLHHYTVTDMDLLMEQMSYRESLTNISAKGDIDELLNFSKQIENLVSQTETQIAGLFKDCISTNLNQLKNQICELRFLNKLQLDLDEIEESLLTEI